MSDPYGQTKIVVRQSHTPYRRLDVPPPPPQPPKPKFDPMLIWTILAAGIAIIGLIWSVVGPPWQQRLRLDASLTSSSQIIGDNLPSQLKVSVNGVEVEQVWLSVLRVANSGARPITVAMFSPDSTLDLHLGKNCRLLDTRLQGGQPDGVMERARMHQIADGIALQPMLLNPRDTLQVQVLTAGCEPTLKAIAQIEGVSEIKSPTKSSNALSNILLALIAGSLGVLGTIIRFNPRLLSKGVVQHEARALMISVALIAMLMYILLTIQKQHYPFKLP